jgi:DNA-binding response OmpR family regulator
MAGYRAARPVERKGRSMAAIKLADIQVLLVEPNEEIRRPLQDGLIAHGLRATSSVASVAEAVALTRIRMFDLVIADHGLPPIEAKSLAKAIRFGEVGRNPFLVAFATIQNSTAAAVTQAIGDGPDAILAKPFAVSMLLDRVARMIDGRQPFVVTGTYVGPDRRQTPRGESQIALIEVPNTLRDKALDQFDPARAFAEIDAARSVVETQVLAQNALVVTTVAKQIVAAYDSGAVDGTLGLLLDMLLERGRETARRLAGTADAHVAALCDSLIKVAEDLRSNYLTPSPKDVRLLQNLGMAIHISLKPEEKIALLSKRIAHSVNEAKRRGVGGRLY